ncbi:thermostable hemolysin [Marinomonas arenicola]|uniref:thermostable hemolysin n=1 Tax=Marinomonas TaxID=28253 RepID=UPI001056067A|nr:thermostable hemolysin [Marinomonas sp. KMM3893]
MQLSNAQNIAPKQYTIAIPTLPYEFVAANASGATRTQLESFIKEGFHKKYQADVNTFMPLLLGIQARGLKAVVGIRRGNEPLFTEQYLPASITEILQEHGIWTDRHNVAELGNLYSQNQRFTLPLLMTVVMSLYLSDVDYLVFSGTKTVCQLLEKLKLPMTFLADVNPKRLVNAEKQWGSYYQNSPKVMLLDVKKSVSIALMQPELEALLELVKMHLQPLLLQMEEL